MKKDKSGILRLKSLKRVGLCKKNLFVLKELGYCYAKQGEWEKAKECYEKVLFFYPEDSNAKKNLEILLENKTK